MSTDICVRIDEFTDPLCPWAWSAEPFRRRLQWLYEGRIEWVPRMVVLADTPEDQVEKGFTPEKFASNLRKIAHEHRMPIDTRVREYVPATAPACLAVVAARLNADPLTTRRLLRALRVRHFAGEQIDEPETVTAAAGDAGIDPGKIADWSASAEAAAELERDRADARRPSPAANVLDHKLANWSGGRRYSCPTYEITRLSDDVTIAVPGFQPFAVYDTILANLVPGMERREPAETATEVLEWTRVPLATQEVAVLCENDFDDAREELGRIAVQQPVGADGFWRLDGAG